MGPKQALAILDGMRELVVSRGKKVVRIDLKKEKPDRATLEKLIIGPSGNLRAPTLRVGKTVLVGFDPDSYRDVLV